MSRQFNEVRIRARRTEIAKPTERSEANYLANLSEVFEVIGKLQETFEGMCNLCVMDDNSARPKLKNALGKLGDAISECQSTVWMARIAAANRYTKNASENRRRPRNRKPSSREGRG